MKRSLSCLFFILFSLTAQADIHPVQACFELDQVKNMRKELDYFEDSKIVDVNQWVDTRLKKDRQKATIANVAKIAILGFFKKVNPLTIWAVPSELGSGTMIGMYIKNPEGYQRFLKLSTKSGCRYLSYQDREAKILREITHEVWLELKKIHNLF